MESEISLKLVKSKSRTFKSAKVSIPTNCTLPMYEMFYNCPFYSRKKTNNPTEIKKRYLLIICIGWQYRHHSLSAGDTFLKGTVNIKTRNTRTSHLWEKRSVLKEPKKTGVNYFNDVWIYFILIVSGNWLCQLCFFSLRVLSYNQHIFKLFKVYFAN